MAKLVWDQTGERLYETGVKNCVLYIPTDGVYSKGVAWNGITAVNESPSGAEPNPLYADDIKYLNLMSTEEFGASIEAYTYPDEFAQCDGSASIAKGVSIGQQTRKTFVFAIVLRWVTIPKVMIMGISFTLFMARWLLLLRKLMLQSMIVLRRSLSLGISARLL